MSKLRADAVDLLLKIEYEHIDIAWDDTPARRMLVRHGLIVGRASKCGHRRRYGLTEAGRNTLAQNRERGNLGARQ